MGVKVHLVMKWHSLYQSVSHSVTAWVSEYWLPLSPAPLHTAVALPLGNSCSYPVLSFLSHFFASSPAFFYLNFTSCPFSVYYFFISNSGSLGREEGGKHAKRCGIFFIILAPMAIRHKALCPFLHAFPHAQRSPLKLPSSTPHMKSHSSPQANPLPSRRSFHSSVCCPRLLLPA